MKIITAVAVAAFCAVLQIVSVQGDFAAQLEQVNSQIEFVQHTANTVRELQYIGVFPRIIGFIKFGQANISEALETRYNETVDYIQESVRTSTAAGKSPASCETKAKDDLDSAKVSTLATYDACFDVARDWLRRIADALEANLRKATELLAELNLIYPYCYGNEASDMESCIVKILTNSTQSVKEYKTTTVTYLEGVSNDMEVQEEIKTCFDAAELALKTKCDSSKTEFETCLAAL